MRLVAIVICCCAPLSALAQITSPNVPYTPARTIPSTAQAHIHPAVARIVAPAEGSISYGSGTLVYANDQWGLVITNWHVINEATGQISVHFPDGFYSVGAVQNVDRDWDLAVIAIRRPPGVQPVRMADAAPRPGEMLTIAGYGAGTYRAASGVCTQYVAPGTTFPFEMVEVAVSARQGDSGGPIFNSRGELAGVLFGEGNGRTSGSYCGRVKWFLSSIVPDVQRPLGAIDQPIQVAQASEATSPAKPAATIRRFDSQSSPTRPPVGTSPPAHSLASSQRAPIETTGVPSARAAEPVALEPQYLGWHDLAGETLGEQAKSVLAAIGALALILHALRWLSSEPTEA